MVLKLEIRYWHCTKLPNTPWNGGEVIEFKDQDQYWPVLMQIIKRVTVAGYNVMIRQHPKTMSATLFIDNGRFGQS